MLLLNIGFISHSRGARRFFTIFSLELKVVIMLILDVSIYSLRRSLITVRNFHCASAFAAFTVRTNFIRILITRYLLELFFLIVILIHMDRCISIQLLILRRFLSSVNLKLIYCSKTSQFSYLFVLISIFSSKLTSNWCLKAHSLLTFDVRNQCLLVMIF